MQRCSSKRIKVELTTGNQYLIFIFRKADVFCLKVRLVKGLKTWGNSDLRKYEPTQAADISNSRQRSGKVVDCLGGGFIFFVHPYLEKILTLTIFSKGLKPPTRYVLSVSSCFSVVGGVDFKKTRQGKNKCLSFLFSLFFCSTHGLYKVGPYDRYKWSCNPYKYGP